jgi:hypothetical protein
VSIESNSSLQGRPSNVRRSRRLYVQIRVRVRGLLLDGTPFTEETVTLVVNAHGGLVRLNAETQMGQTLVLQIVSTNENETQEGKVVFLSEGIDAKFHVGIELTKPNPLFWHVSFPPEDWSPAHPDAKPQQ